MSSFSDYIINACLRRIKCNKFDSFYIIYDNHVYVIVLKSYDCDDETIDFDAIKITKYTPDYYPKIYVNLDRLMQLVN